MPVSGLAAAALPLNAATNVVADAATGVDNILVSKNARTQYTV